MSDEDHHEFEVIFEAEGKAVGKMRNEIALTWVKSPGENEAFLMATDEGTFHGGDNTAPPPLAYFATGFVGCLMTQIRAFSKRLNISIDDLTVRSKLHWSGRQVGRNPYVTRPVGFSVDIKIESEAPDHDLIKLVQAAQKGCFIEQTLAQPNKIPHRLKINSGWVDV